MFLFFTFQANVLILGNYFQVFLISANTLTFLCMWNKNRNFLIYRMFIINTSRKCSSHLNCSYCICSACTSFWHGNRRDLQTCGRERICKESGRRNSTTTSKHWIVNLCLFIFFNKIFIYFRFKFLVLW